MSRIMFFRFHKTWSSVKKRKPNLIWRSPNSDNGSNQIYFHTLYMQCEGFLYNMLMGILITKLSTAQAFSVTAESKELLARGKMSLSVLVTKYTRGGGVHTITISIALSSSAVLLKPIHCWIHKTNSIFMSVISPARKDCNCYCSNKYCILLFDEEFTQWNGNNATSYHAKKKCLSE